MTKRLLLFGLLCGWVAASSGCCCGWGWMAEPLGPGTQCDPRNCCGCGSCGTACYHGCAGSCGPACAEPCGTSCGPSCGPACGSACAEPACGPACGASCGSACGSCGQDCWARCTPNCGPCCPIEHGPPCDPCCDIGCGKYGHHCGPLSLLGSLFACESWCGGCGEVYLGDFHGDPPDCCDPCDRCGSYTGSGGCSSCGNGVPMASARGPVVRRSANGQPTLAPKSTASPKGVAGMRQMPNGEYVGNMTVVSDTAVPTTQNQAQQPRRAVRR